MNHQNQFHHKWPVFFILLFSICLLFSSLSFAEKPLFPDYPISFNIQGEITRISDKDIVIGDMLFKLTTATECYTSSGYSYGPSVYQIGDIVGLITDPEKQRNVLSIWKLTE